MNNLKIFFSFLFVITFLQFGFTQISEFEGAIKVGDDQTINNTEGVIRWNTTTNDFEGNDGQIWKSLTEANSLTTYVSSEAELVNAITSNVCHIVLINDITLTSRINLDNPIVIESCGTKKTINSNGAFKIRGDSVTIRNIRFQSDGTGEGILIQSGASEVWLDFLTMNNYYTAIYKTGGGPVAPESKNVKITNTGIYDSTVIGSTAAVIINWNTLDILIENVVIDGSLGEGIEITNGCSGKVSNLTVKNVGEIGFELWNTTNTTYPYSSFEVTNVSARNCGKWGVSFANARVTASNITTHNTVLFGVEIVGQVPYEYNPVQLSNVIISGVKSVNLVAIGISLDKHAGANISNFHFEGMDTNPDTGLAQQSFGVQIWHSEHFSIHHGQILNASRGMMVHGDPAIARNGSIMDNSFLNVGEDIHIGVAATNINLDNNITW